MWWIFKKYLKSFRCGLNILSGLLGGETKLGVNALHPDVPSAYDLKTEISGNGLVFEGVAGLKYTFNERWSVATVFRTGSKIEIECDAKSYVNGVMSEKSDITFKVKQSPTSTIGALYKPNKKIKLSADFSQTWWNGFSNKITVKNPSVYLTSQPNIFDWPTLLKFRLGLERFVDESFSSLLGYAFDTPAIDKNSIDFST